MRAKGSAGRTDIDPIRICEWRLHITTIGQRADDHQRRCPRWYRGPP
jgi:hypothetical protein